MVNILLTMRCNRACGYCFAKEKIRSYVELERNMDITPENFETVLDFLVKGNCNVVQLAGGEPTLHPRFDEFLISALEKGMYVNLLSNCLWDEKKNELFSRVPPSKLGFLLNIDRPDTYNSNEWQRIRNNLAAHRGRWNTTLSFNIFENPPQCDYIFDLLLEYAFKNVRLSFSVPVVFGDAKNLAPRIEEYPIFSAFILNFVRRATSLGASVKMDNTVPVCMFSKNDLADLILDKVLEPQRNFLCFPPIDIGPDLRVWRCFGTSGVLNRRLEDFRTFAEMYDYYELACKAYQTKIFPMDKCYECKYAANGVCQAGCIGFSIAQCNKIGRSPPQIFEEEFLEMKLRVAQNTRLKEYSIPTSCYVLENEKGIFEIPKSMKPVLDSFNGVMTVREAVKKLGQEIHATKRDGGQLCDFLQNVVSDSVLPIVRRLFNQGFLTEQEHGIA